jgi:aspartate carbamoyltransferase catalytic subunit
VSGTVAGEQAGAAGASAGIEPAPGPAWPHRHLLDTDVLTWPQIELILDTARHMAEIVAGARPRSTALKGIGVTNLFYEASTRTRVSFEVAARHLSADVVNVSIGGSSIEKGESLLDTMRTLEALGAKVLVLRHATSGAPYLVAREFRGAVVNAGDGRHAHPTQALVDLFTLLRRVPGGSLRGR